MNGYVPAGHWSLDFDDLSRPHSCPMWGGARRWSLHLLKEGKWPPSAPVFRLTGTASDYSMFRRWLRHLWLENDAEFAAITVVSGLMGFGKSQAVRVIGHFTDKDYDETKQLVYTTAEFAQTNLDLPPGRPIFWDEALSRALWKRLWNADEAEQTLAIQQVLEQVRNKKHPLYIVGQVPDAFTDIITAVARWRLSMKTRDPISGTKFGNLEQAVIVEVYDKRTHGKKREEIQFYKMAPITIPPIPERMMAWYRQRRDEGLIRKRTKFEFDVADSGPSLREEILSVGREE